MAALACLLWIAAAASAQTAPRDVRYADFEGGGPDQGPGSNVSANMTRLAERFGAIPADAQRIIAYGVQQIRVLSRSTAVVRRDIEQALDLAERTGIPVFLHIDACYGWGADNEPTPEDAPAVKFWQHPEMREWDRFPDGDALPERVPRALAAMGTVVLHPAPAVPAFGAPKFVAFATAQLDAGVLAPLTERLARWQRNGRAHLFAGLNLGWEAHIPDYTDPALRRAIERTGGDVRAQYPSNARGVRMDPALVGRSLGYASLHWRGWDETRLLETAKQEGISRDENFRRICYASIHDYMTALAKACHDRGLGGDRVYARIVALATVEPASNNAFADLDGGEPVRHTGLHDGQSRRRPLRSDQACATDQTGRRRPRRAIRRRGVILRIGRANLLHRRGDIPPRARSPLRSRRRRAGFLRGFSIVVDTSAGSGDDSAETVARRDAVNGLMELIRFFDSTSALNYP